MMYIIYEGEIYNVCINLFGKSRKKIRLSDKEEEGIDLSIEILKTRLKYYFGSRIDDILVFGSYKRNTNLCRRADDESDVDIMVVFNVTNSITFKPQTYINSLKSFMEEKYSSSEIYQSNPCAILNLHHIKFEITPAIKLIGNLYQIPNKQKSYLDWLTTNAFELDNIYPNVVSYKPIVRLVKYWNVLNGKYFASYELEKKVLTTYFYSNNLKENLFQILKSIHYDSSMPQYVKDYIIKTQDVINYIKEWENSSIEFLTDLESKIKTIFKDLD